MRNLPAIFAALFGAAALFAEAAAPVSAPEQSDPSNPIWGSVPEVVATVGGKPVTRQEFVKTFLESLPEGKLPPEATAETVAQAAPGVVKFQVARLLLEPKFAASGITPSFERSKATIRQEIDALPPADRKALAAWLATQNETIDQYIDGKAKNPKLQFQHAFREFAAAQIYRGIPAAPTSVSRAEQEKFYHENSAEFKAPADPADSIRTSHILISAPAKASAEVKAKAKEKAERLLAELRKDPARFEELARNESDCPSSEYGGSIDPFLPRQKRLSQKYEAAAAKLKIGEISPAVETEFGCHLIRRDALKPARQLTFEESTPDIEAYLITQKRLETARQRQEAMMRYLAELEAAGQVSYKIPMPELK